MTSIIKAGIRDSEMLAGIGRQTFIESHGHSASASDIASYVNEKYTPDIFRQELENANNIYHTIYHKEQPAGYSKMIFDSVHPNIALARVTKLERLYLLKEFYNLKLGKELMEHNIQISKLNGQQGMWLFVWTQNERALQFYQKSGFQIIGSHDFKISEHHSNPNHQMLLLY